MAARLLSRLLPRSRAPGLPGALEEALASGLLEAAPGPPAHYRFAHGFDPETLIEGLSASRRARLHARVARALETYYGEDAALHAAELAAHFAQAIPFCTPDKLVASMNEHYPTVKAQAFTGRLGLAPATMYVVIDVADEKGWQEFLAKASRDEKLAKMRRDNEIGLIVDGTVTDLMVASVLGRAPMEPGNMWDHGGLVAYFRNREFRRS